MTKALDKNPNAEKYKCIWERSTKEMNRILADNRCNAATKNRAVLSEQQAHQRYLLELTKTGEMIPETTSKKWAFTTCFELIINGNAKIYDAMESYICREIKRVRFIREGNLIRHDVSFSAIERTKIKAFAEGLFYAGYGEDDV